MAGDPPAPTLALVAAVALDQLVVCYVGEDHVSLKWPNDLLVDGAKIAGILLERVDDAVVVGFGLNIAHHPDGLDRPATSLAAAGVAVPDAADILLELAESFSFWLARWRGEGLGVVRRKWLQRAHPVGTALAAGSVEGLFDGLDESGALRLRLADGSVHVMHAGDVFLI